MKLPKIILPFFGKSIKFNKTILIPYVSTNSISANVNSSFLGLGKCSKFSFSQNRNTVSDPNQGQKYGSFEVIRDQIQRLTQKISETDQMKELGKIIYPEALLNGQQNSCKLARTYQAMMEYLQRQNLEHKHFQYLIKAGDFYSKIKVRRLKALKPYLKAKQQMQVQSLHKKLYYQKSYKDLCSKIDMLIKQQIKLGQCKRIQNYYAQGLQLQNTINQLQALHYYYKGLCISEYRQIPDKLLHFDLLAHYTFLSELMRPKCPAIKNKYHYQLRIQGYQHLQDLANKWWKQQFQHSTDINRKKRFGQTWTWTLANKGTLLYHAKKYQQAIKCYEKVIDYYKNPKNSDIRIKIFSVISNLQKCYSSLGQTTKGLSFLEWAHDFVKQQVAQDEILRTKYLKPIDELIISFHHQHFSVDKDEDRRNKLRTIQKELNQILQ